MEHAFNGAELHHRHRGGADDRRRRRPRPRQRDRVAARDAAGEGGRPARAHGVGARDRHEAVREHRRGRPRSCAACARASATRPRRRGLAIGSAGTHPFAMWEDQRIVAPPRYRDLISALRFVARQELIFGHARPRRHRRPGEGDPRRQRDARPCPVLLALSRQLAVLAGGRDRPALHAHADLPRVPARRDPARATTTGRTTSARSPSWSSPA